MPVLFIEAPPGIRPEAKKTMVEKMTAAIDEAYHIGDTLIFLREYPVEKCGNGWAPPVGKPQNPGGSQEDLSHRLRSNFAAPDPETGSL